MYGPVASGWEIKDGRFRLDVEIPPNTTATVRLPNARVESVSEGGAPLGRAAGVSQVAQDGRSVQFTVGSGRYAFSYPWP